MKQYLIAFSLLIGVCFNSNAQKETYDILSFTPPAGFTKAVGKVGILYTLAKDNNTKNCSVTIYQSRSSSDNVQQEFLGEWTVLIKNSKKVEPPKENQMSPPDDGWTAISGVVPVHSERGNYIMMLLSIVGHKRVTSVIIETNSDDFEKLLADFITSIAPETKIAEALAAATTVSSPTPGPINASSQVPSPSVSQELVPSTGNKSISGVWWTLATTTTLGGVTNAAGTGYASFGSQSSSKVKRIAFFDDGTYCEILPSSGLLDYVQQRKNNPNYWGTYSLNNEEGKIKLDGFSTIFPFTYKNNEVIFSDNSFIKIQRVDHFRFQGLFTAEKNPTAYNGPEPTIQFYSDGRFEDHGAINWVRHVKEYTEDTQDRMTGSGTYDVVDYTITFSYSDGRLIRMTFLEAPPDPTQVRLGVTLIDRK